MRLRERVRGTAVDVPAHPSIRMNARPGSGPSRKSFMHGKSTGWGRSASRSASRWCWSGPGSGRSPQRQAAPGAWKAGRRCSLSGVAEQVLVRRREPGGSAARASAAAARGAPALRVRRRRRLRTPGREPRRLDQHVREGIAAMGFPGQPSHPICHGVGARAHEPPYAHAAGGGGSFAEMILAIEPGCGIDAGDRPSLGTTSSSPRKHVEALAVPRAGSCRPSAGSGTRWILPPAGTATARAQPLELRAPVAPPRAGTRRRARRSPRRVSTTRCDRHEVTIDRSRGGEECARARATAEGNGRLYDADAPRQQSRNHERRPRARDELRDRHCALGSRGRSHRGGFPRVSEDDWRSIGSSWPLISRRRSGVVPHRPGGRRGPRRLGLALLSSRARSRTGSSRRSASRARR